MLMNMSEQKTGKKEARIYPLNGIRLCIDRTVGNLVGRIYSKLSKNPIPFESSKQMILEADDFFDHQGYPQRFLEPRSFQKNTGTISRFHFPKQAVPDAMILEQKGDCFTLDVIVQSRRQAGCQGIVIEPEGDFVSDFKSELELLMILENELKKHETGKGRMKHQ